MSERFAWVFDKVKQKKIWVADMWSRNNIQKMQAVNDPSVLCTVTPIEPTLSNGTHYALYGGCYYYKIGHHVHVHIGVDGLTSGTITDLWYMPVGYRPKTYISVVGTGGSMSTYARLRISEAGRVYISANATAACVDIEYDAFS